MDTRILVTLGPSSLKPDIIAEMESKNLYLFRINLSHTPIDILGDVIREVQDYTDTPLCLDSEGAQIRNELMADGEVHFIPDEIVNIHFESIMGDSNNISFTPKDIAKKFKVGDEIKIDFNSVLIKIIEVNQYYCLANVVSGGMVGSRKAVDLKREIELEAISLKDKQAIEIGKKLGVKHFALSFAGSGNDVELMRSLTGKDTTIISKIESIPGIRNLETIVKLSDEILIDRGDMSRQISIEKIPFLQRRIVSFARSKSVPIYVATNLLESMVKSVEPTRAEVNDVVSTLLMGANGLVLAAETAVGKYPLEAVKMINKLIAQFEKWTPNTSTQELLAS